MGYCAIKWVGILSAFYVLSYGLSARFSDTFSLFLLIMWVALSLMSSLSVLHCKGFVKQNLCYILTALFISSALLKLFDLSMNPMSNSVAGESSPFMISRVLDSTLILIALHFSLTPSRTTIRNTLINPKAKRTGLHFCYLVALTALILQLTAAPIQSVIKNPLFNPSVALFNLTALAVSSLYLHRKAGYVSDLISQNVSRYLLLLLCSELILMTGFTPGAHLLHTGAAWYLYKAIAGDALEMFRYVSTQEIISKCEADCLARKRAEERLLKQEMLRDDLAKILTENRWDRLLDTILLRAVSLLGGSGGELGVVDNKRGLIKIESCVNIDSDRLGRTFAFGEDLIGSVALSRKPLLIHSSGVGQVRLPHYPFERWSEIISVPVECAGQLIAVIVITENDLLHEFTHKELKLLMTFADQVAIVIKNTQYLEQIRLRAETDSLTGLYNRGHFITLAKSESERALRYNHSFSVLMIDIDHFKMINDTYGHSTGDQVIVKIADLCKQMFRKIDVVGRYGGEEFIALLPETDSAMAVEVAERFRQAVAELAIQSAINRVHVTVSLGVSCVDCSSRTTEDLVERADEALYFAKSGGRNRTCCWNTVIHSELAKARAAEICK